MRMLVFFLACAAALSNDQDIASQGICKVSGATYNVCDNDWINETEDPFSRVLRPRDGSSEGQSLVKDLNEKGFGFFRIEKGFPFPQMSETWYDESDNLSDDEDTSNHYIYGEGNKLLTLAAKDFFGCTDDEEFEILDDSSLFLKNQNKLVIGEPWFVRNVATQFFPGIGRGVHLDMLTRDASMAMLPTNISRRYDELFKAIHLVNIWIPFVGYKELALQMGPVRRETDLDMSGRGGGLAKEDAIKRWANDNEFVRTDFGCDAEERNQCNKSNCGENETCWLERVASGLGTCLWQPRHRQPNFGLVFYSASSEWKSDSQLIIPHTGVFIGNNKDIAEARFDDIVSVELRFRVYELHGKRSSEDFLSAIKQSEGVQKTLSALRE